MLVVIEPIVEFGREARRDPEPKAPVGAYVAPIEQLVDGCSKPEPIRYYVRPFQRKRLDVGRLEDRPDSLAGHGAPVLVGVENAEVKRALAESGRGQVGSTVAFRCSRIV